MDQKGVYQIEISIEVLDRSMGVFSIFFGPITYFEVVNETFTIYLSTHKTSISLYKKPET